MTRDSGRFEGIAIRRRAFSESSFMVVWFTRERGILTTAVRGVRRAGSPFAALDLYQTATVVFTESSKGGAHNAREIEALRRRDGLGGDYARLCAAACLGGWVEKLLEPDHAEPEVYELLASALDWLETHAPRWELLERFEARLCRLFGLGPIDGNASDSAALLASHGHGEPSAREAFRVLMMK